MDKVIQCPLFRGSLKNEEISCLDFILLVFRHVLIPSNISVTAKRKLVDNMINAFRSHYANYSPKLHYIDFHLEELLSRQVAVSDQHEKNDDALF